MNFVQSFERQITEHDLRRLFVLNDHEASAVLDKALRKADTIFSGHRHLLAENDGDWIARRWEAGIEYGYRLKDSLASPARTALDYAQCLERLDTEACAITDGTFKYLFSSPKDGTHWSKTRQGNGIKSILSEPAEGDHQSKLLAQAQNLNAAINEIAELPPDGDCQAFYGHLIQTRAWKSDSDLTVLFHLVWPQFFPVWYLETADGYSQVRGMESLLDAVSAEIGFLRRTDVNPRGNYSDYSAAYRLLLRIYHQFVYPRESAPIETPHFDFFTRLLAEHPAREALRMLLDRKALVLYGVPGTGKTHTALNELAPVIANSEGEQQRIKTVQFHPGYSYSDFIIGIRPRSDSVKVTYPVEPGTLYCLAAEAALALEEAQSTTPFGDGVPLPDDEGEDKRKHLRFVLVIDEINRADLAKVLGEAMFQLEYRGKKNAVRLPMQMLEGTTIRSVLTGNVLDSDPFKGGREFYLPENLYLIGTMNHADRSISGFDMALRRRFAWAEHTFSPASLRQILAERCKDTGGRPALNLANAEAYVTRCRNLNARIEGADTNGSSHSELPLNRDHVIGQSYFAEIVSIVRQSGQHTRILPAHLETLWLYYLAPLLEDYLGYEAHQYRNELKVLQNEFIAKL